MHYNCTNTAWSGFVYIPLMILLIFCLGFILSAKKTKLSYAGFLLTLVGGLANFFERYLTGCVRDYINFFGLFYFNIFDLMVTLGIVLIILVMWKRSDATK
jgi:lipoprotein signal peptidase